MKKILYLITIIILIAVFANIWSDDKPKAKKEYKVTLSDGTVCEWFDVRYEMEMVSTTRKLRPEEYQMVADSFHFPKSKMVYFHLPELKKDGQHYGTLTLDITTEVKNFNPDSLKSVH